MEWADLMRTIAVTNQKGGSGKTTTTVCLAGALSEEGARVLVVDLDSSCNATSWLGGHAAGGELLEGWARGQLAPLVQSTSVPGVDLIPGSPGLASADRRLAGEVGAETLLRGALGALDERWEVVLLDCPPSLGLVNAAALIAADEALVPVETRALPLEGLRDLLDTIAVIRERGLNDRLTVRGLVAVKYDRRTSLSRTVVEILRRQFGAQLLTTVIPETTKIAEAPLAHQPITIYRPDAIAARKYRELAQEIAA